jgi:hypothetical protein
MGCLFLKSKLMDHLFGKILPVSLSLDLSKIEELTNEPTWGSGWQNSIDGPQ